MGILIDKLGHKAHILAAKGASCLAVCVVMAILVDLNFTQVSWSFLGPIIPFSLVYGVVIVNACMPYVVAPDALATGYAVQKSGQNILLFLTPTAVGKILEDEPTNFKPNAGYFWFECYLAIYSTISVITAVWLIIDDK